LETVVIGKGNVGLVSGVFKASATGHAQLADITQFNFGLAYYRIHRGAFRQRRYDIS
jgi:hypothetical protein